MPPAGSLGLGSGKRIKEQGPSPIMRQGLRSLSDLWFCRVLRASASGVSPARMVYVALNSCVQPQLGPLCH